MVDFRLIKGKIEKYKLSSLIHNTLEVLKKCHREENNRFPFWHLLVLLKWSYLYTTDSVFRRKMQSHDMNELLSLIDSFESTYLKDGFKTNIDLKRSFRILIYQQSPYQDSFYNSIVDRQIILFLKTESNYDIAMEFRNKTGIGLQDFFNYSYLLFIYVNASDFDKRFKYDGILKDDFFKIFEDQFSKEELNSFLNLISIKSPSDFDMLHKLGDEVLQLFESNFYVTKPILLFRNDFYLIHKAILVQSIKHFVYTFLKQNSDTFSTEFGKRVEKYIELGLKEIKIDYKNEKELKRKYFLTKISDYLVADDILIECKAIELHPRSGVLRLPKIISNELDTSITKAYCQLLSTANAIDKNKVWFGIIITYKEMYLGFGKDAWEEFLQKPVELFALENSIELSILPPENLFFIDIEDWDWIIQSIKDKKATLKNILTKARELNTSLDPAKAVFMMRQVLEKHFKIKRLTLSYLKDAHKEIDLVYQNLKEK